MAQITITLVKSPIGRIPVQKRTVKALGLGKLGSSVTKEDTPALRGMASSISHLVTITEGGKTIKKSAAKRTVSTKETVKAKPISTKESSSAVKQPTAANTVPEIKAWLDSNKIDYSGVKLKADLLALVK